MSFSSGQVLTAAQLNNLDIDSLTISGATSATATFTTDGDDYKFIASGAPENWFYLHNVTDDLTRFLIDDTGKAVFGGQMGNKIARTPLTVSRNNKLGSSFTGTTEGEGLCVDQITYTAGNYVGLVEGAYQYDTGFASHVRMAARYTGSGSSLHFGTSNNYASGITNQALSIDHVGNIGIKTSAPESILHLAPGTDLTPDGNGVGHIMIDGNSYTSFFTMDGTGTWIGNNSASRSVILAVDETNVLEVTTNNAELNVSGGTYIAVDPGSGAGVDADWISVFGVAYGLKRNSSLAAEKENISADLGTHLTADMIDSVVPKMWNRISAPGIPEIGPIAEDMEAISPFLAAKSYDANGDPELLGINRNSYLSLLVLAVKDLRARVAALEA